MRVGPLALALMLAPSLALALPTGLPEAAVGFATHPLVALPAPTAITFGDDGHLYATTLAGDVLRVPLAWTAAGPVVSGAPETIASGFSQPLGIAQRGTSVFVSDSTAGQESFRLDGQVTRVDLVTGTQTVVLGGLPNGRHNTNHLRFGPDGRLYVANGNPNDNGRDGGDRDVFPYSGAILSVDAAQVSASPAILRWRDGTQRIPEADVATHPQNAGFREKVDVLAYGFRNVFGVAFGPDGTPYTAMNGADTPSSQDALFRISHGTDYAFPFCLDEGATASVDVVKVANPVFPTHDCSSAPVATALLGWHVCATGLDVAPAVSPFGRAVYIAECGPFFPEPQARGVSTHDTGHKVARVLLDDAGEATEVQDFLVGLPLPTDVLFGPDGALYVADATGVLRVAALPV